MAGGLIEALGGECRVTANLVRATIPEDKVDAAVDIVRRVHGRLVSITPVRGTLEDYFLQKLGNKAPQSAEVTL